MTPKPKVQANITTIACRTAAATMPIRLKTLLSIIQQFFLVYFESLLDSLRHTSFIIALAILCIFIRRSLNFPDPNGDWKFVQERIDELLEDREDLYDKWQDQEEGLEFSDED
ncbi:hypothetical protein BDZ45DRAFT_743388 [Acephala macrosclerotiorum]|nr:hypothetical protein BDZ45DRAFT_743388 [Acephala macrosclerotiorum]